MADLRGFDANQVEPSTDFDPLPAGKYLAVIAESEMKPNKAGTGHFLQLTFQVMEGPFKNRLLWARLNLDNPNATAVAIARAVYFNAKILIMDEPTAALGPHETQMVAELIQELKAQGLGIFLIEHDIHNVMKLCDRASVMKNGQLVGTVNVNEVTDDDILGMIILGKKPPQAV